MTVDGDKIVNLFVFLKKVACKFVLRILNFSLFWQPKIPLSVKEERTVCSFNSV